MTSRQFVNISLNIQFDNEIQQVLDFIILTDSRTPTR